MCHVHDGQAHLPGEGVQLETKPVTQRLVEGGERFVQQEHPGAGDQRPGQGDTLPLPAGECRRVPALVTGESHEVERFADTGAALGEGHLGASQRIFDVAPHVPVRPDRMLLEHHPQLALLRRYGDTGTGDDAVIEQDAARCGGQEPGDTAQQRRLPGSRRADESEELPVRDLQVDVGEADGTGAVSQRGRVRV